MNTGFNYLSYKWFFPESKRICTFEINHLSHSTRDCWSSFVPQFLLSSFFFVLKNNPKSDRSMKKNPKALWDWCSEDFKVDSPLTSCWQVPLDFSMFFQVERWVIFFLLELLSWDTKINQILLTEGNDHWVRYC